MGDAGGGGGPEENQHHGHIMQSRTTSQAHVIRKTRSRSKGRRRRERQPQQEQEQQVQRPTDETRANSYHYHESNHLTKSSQMYQEGKINEYGRCPRHPNVELCAIDPLTSEWRVLLQDCPLCSLDGPGLDLLRGDTANRFHDGGSSSQATPTPSTKTNQTQTTEEESSVKSWTMSDASGSEGEIESVPGGRAAAPEQWFKSQKKPPQTRGPRQKPASNNYASPPQDNYNINRGGNNHPAYYQNNPPMQNKPFDQLQSLKDLGKKFVTESEQQSSSFHTQTSRGPPPPPPPKRAPLPTGARRDNTTSNVNSLSRRNNRNPRPPPRNVPTAASGGGRVHDESSEILLGEASDIIARMENLTEGEPRIDTAKLSSRRNLRRQQQQQQEQQQQQQKQHELLSKIIDMEELNAWNTQGLEDAEVNDPIAARIADAEAAAAEKRARAERRKENRKAAKLRAQEQRHRGNDDGQTFTLPMKGGSSNGAERGRGSAGRNTEDILQAAAQIRARARRSTSRSRERVKEASLFCGETPEENNGHDDETDVLSLCSSKQRSILNPHGLEEQPKPVAVERRSQSRERRRSKSQTRGKIGDADRDGQGGSTVRGSRRGRKQNAREDNSSKLKNQSTTTEELLTRRREMRQQIAQRQKNAQSRNDLKGEVLEAWSGDAQESNKTRSRASRQSSGERPGRGRSRSLVRDGVSKIRSSSLFRKRGDQGGGGASVSGGEVGGGELDDLKSGYESIDSAKKSVASFRNMLSRGRPRSRSRARSSMSQRGEQVGGGASTLGGETGGWDTDDLKSGYETVDSANKSTSSFRRMLSRGRPRSRSRARSSMSQRSEQGDGGASALGGETGGWDADDLKSEYETIDSANKSTSSFRRVLSRGRPRSRSRARSSMSRRGEQGDGGASALGGEKGGGDMDDLKSGYETVDNAIKSTSSFRRMLSKGRPRSRSRARSSMSQRGEQGDGGASVLAGETGGGDAYDLKSGYESTDSANKSTSSFRRMLSTGRSRSRSFVSRGGQSLSHDDGDGSDYPSWAAKSETFAANENFDARSTGVRSEIHSISKQSTTSRGSLGVFKRSQNRSGKSKSSMSGGGMGMVRSLSRGRFRSDHNDDADIGEHQYQHAQSVGYDTHSYEIGSMLSTSSGKPMRTRRPSRKAILEL